MVAAAAAWGASPGNNDALALATIVNLTRAPHIVPLALFLAFRVVRVNGSSGARFGFVRGFPWLVLSFVRDALVSVGRL